MDDLNKLAEEIEGLENGTFVPATLEDRAKWYHERAPTIIAALREAGRMREALTSTKALADGALANAHDLTPGSIKAVMSKASQIAAAALRTEQT